MFVFVAVLGGGVALVYRYMEARRTERQLRNDKANERQVIERAALEAFYLSLIDIHHSVKKIRRRMRASSVELADGGRLCERATFEELMDQLEDVQLKVESMMREVEARSELFYDKEEQISEELSTSERYLRRLLHQYEREYAVRREYKANESIALADNLVTFLRPHGGSESDTNYFTPVENVRSSLLELIASKTPTGY